MRSQNLIAMSFFEYKDIVEEGDLVLAFISRNDIKPIRVTKNAILNTRYGNFLHNDMIGSPYGKQMAGAKGYGFIHLLHPTAEMWTISLPHRTQIVYTHDSSYIMQRLNVVNGSRVIEAGTGSGSFTHSFSRSVGLKGRVFTYEFHEPRYLEAKREIEDHGIDVNTFITHRDVCQDGFEIQVPENFHNGDNKINAQVIFLDLPSPWIAINNLNNVIDPQMKVGICCFSPCIEQVHKTVESLQENGWVDIEMVECRGKRWEARKEMVRDVNDVIKRLKDIQSRRDHGIESRKRVKLEQQEDKEAGVPRGFNPFGKGERVKEGDINYSWKDVTKIESEIKTHTSYLTFAFKVPLIIPE
ncbi:tRNA (adenine(58)-N(1))-methyltransferase catalytic subunit Trm61p [[Candida] jaroonii]|uniref:tRNA (Adenine(58)-N(1))-methyltransferase catalytic subunit Trm61p n=1 Tax=[Candida] jaroonii TaxID=467808 RepID=A0ACA9Y3J0_9ASCO|nr:tRNA (adenine(58)-N(1))-methyltransferase catalytic subunit Trm61p [[Candida] jaroonii]